MSLVNEGDKYGHFLLVKRSVISELKLVLKELVHVPTGAQVMHLENDDTENLFCLSFQTLPSDSKGAPHILEHTVLCGSRKFPVKDPFFAMQRRSLSTFMNALTGSDFTCYPAATQVEKDFYNLLDVYLDAVFHPQLKELSFLQEGHRLEFTEKDNPLSPLQIKGIVYNEMKGSMSSIDSVVWHAVLEHLVPDLPYAFNSGGDPKEIPKLTYQELIDFYENFYHPSRCLFYFYGNLPLEKHLDFIAEKTLNHARPLTPLSPIPLQKRFEKPRELALSYPGEGQYIHTFGWLTAPVVELEEVLALTLLDSILMDTDASPLKLAVLGSGLCTQVESYIDTEMSEMPLVIICRGCEDKENHKLREFIFNALEKIAKEGIPFKLVESSLHQIEFERSEIGGDSSPFGLTLFMRAGLGIQHGCPPEQALRIHGLFDLLLEKAKNPHFFAAYIEKYLLKNLHRVDLSFSPDPEYTAKETAAEKAYIDSVRKELNEKQIASILEKTKDLSAYQKQIEGQKLDCLPKVTLSDVSRKTRHLPLHHEKKSNLEIFHCSSFTNQIVYADLIFDIPEMSEEELVDLQLFASLWPQLGANGRSYTQNLEFMHAHTGGIGASLGLYVQVDEPEKARPALQVRGKALRRKLPQFFSLMKEMITSPRLDEKKRIEELLRKMATSLQNNLTRRALRYATQLGMAGLSTPGRISELWHGLSQYQRIQHLAKHPGHLIERLSLLKDKLFFSPAHLVLSCEHELYKEIDQHNFYGLNDLPKGVHKPWSGANAPTPVPSQARKIASPVAFTAKAFKTITYHHSDAPALLIGSLLMENKVLHHRIREQGGAYGAGATYNSLWGQFYFHSYRDPRINHTLHTFTHAIEELASGQFEVQDLEEAKLGIIQQIDQPISPSSRAMVAYGWLREGRTDEMRQSFRDHLLNLTKEKLTHALKTHLENQKDDGVTIVFAGPQLLEKEEIKLPIYELDHAVFN